MKSELIKENRIPIDKNSWPEILSDIRSAFFNNKFDDYFAYISGCYMNEKEITERKDFYISLSSMLSRHLRMTPQLIGAYPYLHYMAEDMADTGDEDLIKSASLLERICSDAQKRLDEKDAKKNSGIKVKPAAIEDCEAFIKKHGDGIRSFFIDELDAKWVLDGDLDSTLAMICELMHLDRGEAESIAALWFNNNANFNQIISWFLDDFCFLLRGAEENEWIRIFCRLAIAYGFEAANFYSYQAEAGFKLRDYPRVIEMVSTLEKKYKITPFLEHLKCFSLWQTSETKECMSMIRRRLENDPRDILAALLAGDIFLNQNMLENSLKAYAYAYHIEPGAADILYSLARAFHACYFTEQLDLCVDKAASINAAAAKHFKFGVELYIKCSKSSVKARVNGIDAGDCPVCLKGIAAGKSVIEWISGGGRHKRLEADLKDGYIHKFKYLPEENKIDSEESRDGRITVYRDGEAVELDELLKDYAVKNLDCLPKPSIDDFVGKSFIEAL